jgi:hypothetical protein
MDASLESGRLERVSIFAWIKWIAWLDRWCKVHRFHALLAYRCHHRLACCNAAGERAKNQAGLLQGQGVRQAHHAQGYPVQDRQGFAVRARWEDPRPTTLHVATSLVHSDLDTSCSLAHASAGLLLQGRGVTTVSSRDTVARQSLCSTKRCAIKSISGGQASTHLEWLAAHLGTPFDVFGRKHVTFGKGGYDIPMSSLVGEERPAFYCK